METITEKNLARKMGVSVDALQQVRMERLRAEDGDFSIDGRTILYSKAGAKKAGLLDDENPPEKKQGAAAEGGKADIKITRRVQNPRVLFGELPDGTKVAVRVQKPQKIAMGTVLPGCTKLGNLLYAYTGRVPRFRGGRIS